MFRKKKLTLEDLLARSGINIYCDTGKVLLNALVLLGCKKENGCVNLNISVNDMSTCCTILSKETGVRILTIWLDSPDPRSEWIIDLVARNSIRFYSDYDLSGKSLILP